MESKNNKVLEDFIKSCQNRETELDYFYILDHLQGSQIPIKEIDELLKKRFVTYEQTKIKFTKEEKTK